MNYKFKKLCICFFVSTFFLVGCGKSKELESYKEQMNTFFDNITKLDANMDAIDVSVDEAAAQEEMLGYLDTIEVEFNNLAALEVPEDFASVETLADEAAENMTQAVALYHQLFDSETYDAAVANAAFEYYSRANVRLQYIVAILHGEIPEGENVTITLEDTLELETNTEETEEGF